ncbi:hypothetical protein ECHHL_0527 [Ehrlichia chaffeensis str. Heartland]|uniref:Uncharacterized protein n=1 Tax=Ehrlichia chaffeensis (strain ATCC CRL-10679 / Arkansas) TaxID=205920 RepID=Q2GGL9_EHRCR|nr:hypothetical protein [Ehrlichia chaffeensis]AHX08517.1 hypothetical protein ECHSTV_0519 [Ehrlichia chaffeensis str. Saint Vincent]ABD44844.1 hypothetical protein ECH_0603 [Ehrlichia chaffeensis str. Arkansas]AHX03685.1 hypothetical protein ECHHL_0527 [Ehrlichia chaffeensis str. Heartland]AHX05594.1 hypothetical protein ECHJAX_0530 [Ehrlichia chaffeensis str. Jax]AHX06584.1 hypothetical protein ECHLIB_0531 [Ehrlichia chaffeensis str. Liberty]
MDKSKKIKNEDKNKALSNALKANLLRRKNKQRQVKNARTT